jgi:hypothetical protein
MTIMTTKMNDLIVYFQFISIFKNNSIEFIFFRIIWQYYEFTLRLFMSRLLLLFVNKKMFQLLIHIFYKLCKETIRLHSIESFILNILQKQIFCVFIIIISSIGLMFCKNIMNHAFLTSNKLLLF